MLPLLLLSYLLTPSTVLANEPATTILYVSSQHEGQQKSAQSNDGKGNLKFTTLEAARDFLRTANAAVKNSTRIVQIQGPHYLSQTFKLDERDSGTIDHPIIYQGTPYDNTTLFGGIHIPPSSFTPVFGKPNVYVTNLYQHGINQTQLGQLGNPYPSAKMELFYGNTQQPMTLARDPNIGTDPQSTWHWAGYNNMTGIVPNTTNAFKFNDTDTATKWMNSMYMDAARNETATMWLHGYFKFDWRDTFVKVSSIQPDAPPASTATRATRAPGSSFTVTTDRKTPPQYPYQPGCRFYAVNSLGLLDSPGEYYISRSSGDLYFMPPTAAGVTESVIVSVLDQVVALTNTQNIVFHDLTISTSQNTVLRVSNSNHINITNNVIANAGSACVGASAVTNTVIGNNVIYGCGGSGASVASGNIKLLISGNSSIVNNTITNFSRVRRTYQPAIGFDSVGLYVANNNISHGPHACIQGGGNNNLFEYNTITHCTFESVDVGAFYVGRSWSQRGNVARYNTFSNIRSNEKLAQESCSQNAFYLDDEMSGWVFDSNTIINATTGVLLGGGRRNSITNNLFINCDNDIQ